MLPYGLVAAFLDTPPGMVCLDYSYGFINLFLLVRALLFSTYILFLYLYSPCLPCIYVALLCLLLYYFPSVGFGLCMMYIFLCISSVGFFHFMCFWGITLSIPLFVQFFSLPIFCLIVLYILSHLALLAGPSVMFVYGTFE